MQTEPPQPVLPVLSAQQGAAVPSSLERLLQALVEGCQRLIEQPDLASGLSAMLPAMGRLTGLDRIYVVRWDTTTCAGHFINEWCADGIVSIREAAGWGPYSFEDFAVVWQPLLAGQPYSSPITAKRGASARTNGAARTQSDLIVPVQVDGALWGAIGFDDCHQPRSYSPAEVQVLRGAASAIAAVVGRERTQEQRLAEAERHAARLHRHSQLLAAVAQTAEELLAARDLGSCLNAALARIGSITSADRAVLVRLDWTPLDTEVLCWQEALNEWTRPGAQRQSDTALQRFAMRRSDPTHTLLLEQLQSEGHILMRVQDCGEPFRSEQLSLGMVWALVYPVKVAGALWGLLGFDYATPFSDYDEADLSALKTVASTVSDALERERMEAVRLAVEQARADQAEASSRALRQREGLLLTVTEATRALLTGTDFDAGIQAGMALLGKALNVIRVGLVQDRPLLPDDAPGRWRMTHEWLADGVSAQMGSAAETGEYPSPEVWQRLRAGQAVVVRMDNADAGFAEDQRAIRTLSILTVPLFVAGRFWGLLFFDQSHDHDWAEHELAVLKTAAACVSAALESERHQARRLASERERADESARLARLLQAVVASTRELMVATDFEAGVLRWLGSFGAATFAIRATLYDMALHAPSGLQSVRMLAEWCRPGITGSIPVTFAEPHLIDPRGADAVMVALTSGRAAFLHTDEVEGPIRSFLLEQGNATVIAVPLFVDGTQRGLISFDHAERRETNPHDLAVLQTAADSLSVIMKRFDAERLAARERDARLALERQRTHEAQALNRLLEGVVAASKALLDEPDLDVGVARWLAHLGQAFDADAANIGCITVPDQSGQGLARTTAEWLRPGLAPVDEYAVPATPDFLAWSDALARGEIVFGRLQDLRDAASIQHWAAQGIQAGLMVPVMLDQRLSHFVAVIWLRPRTWAPAFGALLHTAADGLAAAIKRSEAGRALLAERERSTLERTAELAAGNASMRRTLARLAAAEDVDAFLATALLELRQQAGAEEAFLFAANDSADHGSINRDSDSHRDGLLRLRGSVRADGFQRLGQPGDPPIFVTGFLPTPQAMAGMRHGSWLLWRPVAGGEVLAPRHPDVQRWLQQRGHAADACCLLQVGERCVGLVALHLASAQPLPASRCELLVALSQPMALALELGRMGRAAQQAAQDRAVLAERNRMARDVHDTLAQGFTAISLQLQAAARADSADDRARFVARATQEAQANLVESRRTIRLLRGMAEPGDATHALVHVIEDALASRLSGSTLAWRVLPLPAGVAEPGLDGESRREIKRIAQEAATNALKHAGASLFAARMNLLPDGSLTLRFEDQGCGFDPRLARDGFGLLGMRERAERIGAALHVESQPGGPTAVVVRVPASTRPEASR